MKLAIGTFLILSMVTPVSHAQTGGSSPTTLGKATEGTSAAVPEVSTTGSYTVFNATPAQEAALRAKIQLMRPDVLPLRVFFLPHWKYLDTARIFLLHVPAGYRSLMFTHLPSRTVFIDNDQYQGEEWLGHWLAHELGHLAANSAKEGDAERAAREYRRRLKQARTGGVYALLCSSSVTELGTMLPRAGGWYVYAGRAFGEHTGFVVGCCDWVVQSASNAYLAAALGEFVGGLYPGLSQHAKWSGVTALGALALLNWVGLRAGRTQELTRLAKALAFIALIIACFALSPKHDASLLPAASVTGGKHSLFLDVGNTEVTGTASAPSHRNSVDEVFLCEEETWRSVGNSPNELGGKH